MYNASNVPVDLQEQVRLKVAQCMEKAHKFYGTNFEMPRIGFDVRGRTAGLAYVSEWRVDFNAILLIENREKFIERTVPHECAHLIDYIINPHNHESGVRMDRYGNIRRKKRSIHGPDFKYIMKHVLGVKDATTCHSYDTTNSAVRRKAVHRYQCKTCQKIMTLGPVRHKKMQRGLNYWLRSCRNHEGYEYLGQDNAVSQLKIAANSHKKPTESHKNPTEKRGSKKEMAREIFKNHPKRVDFIEHCGKMGIKKATASTYHHNFKSGKW